MLSDLISPSLRRLLPRRVSQRLLAIAVFLMALTTNAADSQPKRPSIAAAAKEPSATNPATQQAVRSVNELVSFVVQPKLWPLKADSVGERLAALGPWKREQPIPEALTLMAERSGIVARAEIAYSADAKKRWVFMAANFFISDSDLAHLYRELSQEIQTKLGKPRWSRKAANGDAPAAGWKLDKHLELLLGQSPVEGEQLLTLTISEPQGGPGD